MALPDHESRSRPARRQWFAEGHAAESKWSQVPDISRSEVRQHVARAWALYSILVGLSGSALVSLHLLVPNLRPYLSKEWGILENLSATFYLFAAVLSAWACGRSQRIETRKRYIAIPILAALCFLDEVSDAFWRDSIPEWYGVQLKSLHEFAHVAYNAWRDLDPVWMKIAVFALMAVPALAVAFWQRSRLKGLVNLVKSDVSYRFVVLCVLLSGVALVLDRDPGDTFTFYEEWLEMNAALAMLFAAALIPESIPPIPRAKIGGLARSRTFQLLFWVCVAVTTFLGVIHQSRESSSAKIQRVINRFVIPSCFER